MDIIDRRLKPVWRDGQLVPATRFRALAQVMLHLQRGALLKVRSALSTGSAKGMGWVLGLTTSSDPGQYVT